MNVGHLVEMANDIGAYFATEPDRETGTRGICDHLRRFWEPRMQAAIVAHARSGGAGLDPQVLAAVQRLEHPGSAAVGDG